MLRFLSAVVVLWVLVSCRETAHSPYQDISKETFADMYEPAYALNSRSVRRHIGSLMRADSGAFRAEKRTRKYYVDRRPFLWIDRSGVLHRADTALTYLRQAAVCGLDTNKMRLSQIADDIRRLRQLDVLEDDADINELMARVEYNLTRAYIRYTAGQKFGFVNPDKLYNRLEKCDSDTVTGRVTYSHLCDLRVSRPDSSFFAVAVRKAFNDSVGQFMQSVQPRNALYKALVKRLNTMQLGTTERLKTLCNIERSRWRQRGFKAYSEYERYVIVNIPSYSLTAISDNNTLSMRVAVGTLEHKTPLLTSSIMRMDVNPQWIIPKSIAKGVVGRTGYMHSEGMFVIDKKRGKLPPEYASYQKVMDGEQYIVQAGGAKNPLGKIIFRFNNSFSVYLHDTSSPWLFKRNDRALSHGCVRVEKPLELALLLHGDDNDDVAEKIRYSMTVPIALDNDSLNKAKIDRKLLVNSVKVSPEVPIFITYYTVFLGNGGELVSLDDVYGYDEALIRELSPLNQ